MKLHIKHKEFGDRFFEVDWLHIDKEKITYYQYDLENRLDLEKVELVKLDGEVLYRDSENELDLEGFVKLFTNVFMGIKEIEKRSIEEYKKEQENAK